MNRSIKTSQVKRGMVLALPDGKTAVVTRILPLPQAGYCFGVDITADQVDVVVESAPAHFHTFVNLPGCLPDSDAPAAWLQSFDEAKECLIEQLEEESAELTPEDNDYNDFRDAVALVWRWTEPAMVQVDGWNYSIEACNEEGCARPDPDNGVYGLDWAFEAVD